MSDVIDINKKSNDPRIKDIKEAIWQMTQQLDILERNFHELHESITARYQVMQEDFIERWMDVLNILFQLCEKYPELKPEELHIKYTDTPHE